MYAIEFEADIRDGLVKIPDQYERLKNSRARIVVMISEEERVVEGQPVSLDFSDCQIAAFAGKDGVELQREMRDGW